MLIRGLRSWALAVASSTIVTTACAQWSGSPDAANLICTTTVNQLTQFTTDGQGGAIFSWNGKDGNSADVVLAQRLDADGIAQWGPGGIAINPGTPGFTLGAPQRDANGGAFIPWASYVPYNYYSIRVQHVNRDGLPLLPGDGIELLLESSVGLWENFLSDNQGGALLVWFRQGNLHIKHIDSSGAVNWTYDAAEPDPAMDLATLADGEGGVFICWRSRDKSIRTQHVNKYGNAVWPAVGKLLSTDGEIPAIAPDGSGGAIFTWLDFRDVGVATGHAYAQRLDAAGNSLWATNGLRISSSQDTQFFTYPVSDGKGGATVGYSSYNSETYLTDVRVQRISSKGKLLWSSLGKLLSRPNSSQYITSAVPDGANGAIVFWHSGQSLFAQRVNSLGMTQWFPRTGILCVQNDISSVATLNDPTGGAFYGWNVSRDNVVSIFVNRISSRGRLGSTH
ncbi:MAG: hypothetical protein K1X53_01560 [Candidatus Sumerlaeaceae bacterium]|nr:hypothetical protein [Candidatus Sumerlaeaceae bacterium]